MRKTAYLSEVLSTSELKEYENIEKAIKEFGASFNILSYFESIFNENVWTRIFAFLLDSKAKHEQSVAIFNYWIRQLEDENKNISKLFLEKLKERPSSIHVKTEWTTAQGRRVDLLIELNDSSGKLIGIIGLENKVYSGEQTEQVSDYQNSISEVFPEIPLLILFCTPNGRESKTAILDHNLCPYLPIKYSSFQLVCDHFSQKTEGELQLILISLSNYLKLLLARVRRKELFEKTISPTMAFKERNKFSPVIPFFNQLQDHFLENHEFPFTWGIKTFSTDEIDIFINDLGSDNLSPCYMLNALNKEPRVGDYFVVRLMIWSMKLYKPNGNNKKELRDLIHTNLRFTNSRNEAKHWGPWINIWTSEKYQLVDLGNEDIKNMLILLHSSIDLTYSQLKKTFNNFTQKHGKDLL